jgi:hypothetical protein
MKFIKFVFALCMLCTAHSIFAQQPQKGTWNFLVPGTTHSGESPLKTNKGWLALVKINGEWELKETDIITKKTKSDITDYDIEIKSSHKDAIAMFRLPQLTPGPIVSPTLPNGLLKTNFTKENGKYPIFKVNFNSEEYVFKGSKEKADYPGVEILMYDAAVVEAMNKRSAIGDTGGDSTDTDSSNNSVGIVWIGDLDRDGKIDVITRVMGTNSSGLCLYLSSNANGKELFGKRLCHEGSGC